MEHSILPQAEQEIIDAFEVDLVRGDISRADIDNIWKNLKPNGMNIDNLFLKLFENRNKAYIVCENHVVGIVYCRPGKKIKKIKKLPNNIGDLPELLYLEIYGSKITKIPDSIGKLQKLIYLRICQNYNLNYIPESIGKLSHLITLFISSNNLKFIPESIGNLSQLKSLGISYCNLKSLPESIGNLSNLERLYISGNCLVHLPESFHRLELEYIRTTDNPLRSLSNINFDITKSYDFSIKYLSPTGQDLLYPWDGHSNVHDGEKDYDGIIYRDLDAVYSYYKKPISQLSKQYCENPNSLTNSEKERLIWEATLSDRDLLESIFPPNNEIIKKINERLENLDLPQIEKEVIDNFEYKLERVDIRNEEDIEEIRFYSRFPERNWTAHDNVFFMKLFDRSNAFLVYNGHIIGLRYYKPPKLTTLPENLGELKELLILNIRGTKIKKIPSSIGKLKKLLSLKIWDNSDLGSLPGSLGNLSNLRFLEIRRNNLTSLPESIGNLTWLATINLTDNFLTLLPESFKNLELFRIDIAGNPLRSLSNINFEGIREYNLTLGDLTEFGKNLLKHWSRIYRFRNEIIQYSENPDHYTRDWDYKFCITGLKNDNLGHDDLDEEELDNELRANRDFEPVSLYYKKSPFQLAAQYCEDPTSLTDNETERLIWEANSSVREILELKFPPENLILKEINNKLRIVLKNEYHLM